MPVLKFILRFIGYAILAAILILGLRMAVAVVFSPIERFLPSGSATPLFWAIQGAVIAVPLTDSWRKRRWSIAAAILVGFIASIYIGPL